MSPADALFAGPREKLLNKLKVFNDMKLNSVSLPFNPKDEIYQANKDKYKHAQFDQPLHAHKVINKTSLDMVEHKDGAKSIRKAAQGDMPRCEFNEHQIFFLMDNQDIMGKNLEFGYFEVAQYVAKLIPQKVWDIKNEKLNIYERIMVACPAIII